MQQELFHESGPSPPRRKNQKKPRNLHDTSTNRLSLEAVEDVGFQRNLGQLSGRRYSHFRKGSFQEDAFQEDSFLRESAPWRYMYFRQDSSIA